MDSCRCVHHVDPQGQIRNKPNARCRPFNGPISAMGCGAWQITSNIIVLATRVVILGEVSFRSWTSAMVLPGLLKWRRYAAAQTKRLQAPSAQAPLSFRCGRIALIKGSNCGHKKQLKFGREISITILRPSFATKKRRKTNHSHAHAHHIPFYSV